MQYAAATGAAGTEKLNPDVPPVEKAIARDLHFLIVNPDPLLLGPDGHCEPVARPTRNLAREERTGTVQGIDIELRVLLNEFTVAEISHQRTTHCCKIATLCGKYRRKVPTFGP